MPICQPRQPINLVEVVDHDQADPALQSHAQLGLGLGVAVHQDPLRREPRVQGKMKLAAGGHVAPQALLGEQTQHRRAWKRLGGEHHVEVIVASGGAGLHECTRTRTQVLLGDDICRCAELARELDRVAPPHLDSAALVEAAAQWEDMR